MWKSSSHEFIMTTPSYSSCRLVQEDVVIPEGGTTTQVSLYYTVDNSSLYHGEEPNFLVVEPDLLVTLKALINAYPHYSTISDLPYDTEEKMVSLHV